MPTITGRDIDACLLGSSDSGDPYLRLGEVMVIKRNHFPGRINEYVPCRQVCNAPDTVWLVPSGNVDQFAVKTSGCAAYSEIKAGFDHWKVHHQSNNSLYLKRDIFADVNVLLAERDSSRRIPLRAALSTRPLYPLRAKILRVKPGEARIWAYVSVAVLNSALGQAFYRAYLAANPEKGKGQDGVLKEAILNMPLAARRYDAQLVERVAESAHQLTMLGKANAALGRYFTEQSSIARVRSLWHVIAALGLPEGVDDAIIETVREQNYIDAPAEWSLRPRDLVQPGVDVALTKEGIDAGEARQYMMWQSHVRDSLLQVGQEWLWAPESPPPISKKSLSIPNDSLESGSVYNLPKEEKAMMNPELAITRDPRRCGGHPTVGATRITVHNIVNQFRLRNENVDRVLADFPHWTREQIRAALDYYAGHRVEVDEILNNRNVAYERLRVGGST